MTDLSDAAKALCNQYYTKNDCNRCPLIHECHRVPASSHDSLNDWRARLNRIAAKHLPPGPEECRAAQKELLREIN